MGQVLKANCNCCGFTKNVSFGGNRSNFKEVCMMPAVDMKKGELINLNYYQKNENEDIVFYNVKKLQSDFPDQNRIHRSFDTVIYMKGNYCPICKTYELDFQTYLMTD